MTTLPHHDAERFGSQCSNNRISPRNSKWLQQNITDMDAKVKAVITLMEEDASSFNRKAEMYFRKRPELMKLIEELYRAYRALAERYNYTTGELQWFHRALAKALPSQVLCEPTVPPEDLSSNSSAYQQSPQTPEITSLNNEFIDTNDVVSKESEVQNLKNALVSIGGKKEDILLKYQETMKKLSNIEDELNCAQMSAKGLSDQASEAQSEVHRLKEAIAEVEVERDAAFLHQQELIARISTLERRISQVREEGVKEGTPGAEIRSKCLENEVYRLQTEKDASFFQYKLCLEKIADVEERTSLAENEAGLLCKSTHRAETEVRKLRNDLDQLNKEKKSVAVEYDRCLVKLLNLESELSCAEDEMRQTSSKVLMEAEKLESAEESYASLEISNEFLTSEVMNLELKIVMKDNELSEKHKELEKLQARVQNEQLCLVKVEAAILTLQNFLSQEEGGTLQLEIKEVLQILKEFNINQHGLKHEQEITPSVENLLSGVSKLKEIKEKLEEEMGLQKGLADTFQKHINVLKQDIKDLRERCQSLKEIIKSLGLNPDCVGSSIEALKGENLRLKEIYKENVEEKEALSKKLDGMEQIFNTNAVVEKSFQWLNADKSALISEKEALLSQLRTITGCVEKLAEKNVVCENPLYDANIELESLKIKSENLEELCKSLDNERSNLVDERSRLLLSLDDVKNRLGSLENKFSEAEKNCVIMEIESEPTLARVEDLKVSIGLEKREQSSLALSSEVRLASLEKHLHFLQEEIKWSKMQFEEEVKRAVDAHFEIFILHIFMQDLEMKNHSLSTECEKHIESSKLREKLVSELERENLEQLVEIELLISEIEKLRADIFRVFNALGFNPGNKLDGNIGSEPTYVHHIIENIEDMKSTLSSYEDESQKLLFENSILLMLLGQLRVEGTEIIREKKILNKELESITTELMMVQNSKHELQGINEHLKSEMKKEQQNMETLEARMEKLNAKQRGMERDYAILKQEHHEALGENRSLIKNIVDLSKEKHKLEEENDSFLLETLVLDNHCTILKNFGTEKAMEINSISKDLQNLLIVNRNLGNEVGLLREKMAMKGRENSSLKDLVEKLEKELHKVEDLGEQLKKGIADEMKIICQKEIEVCLVEEKLKAAEDLNSELCNTLKELTRNHEDTELVKENVQKKFFDLSEENKNRCKEIILLREVNGKLNSEIDEKKNEFEDLSNRFRDEISAEVVILCQKDLEFSFSEEELKSKYEETILVNERLEKEIVELTEEKENQSMEIQSLHAINENLNSELKEIIKESEAWEAEASSFHFNLQISKAYEVVLENKICELSDACETLGNESALKAVEMENMKERVDSKEAEICSFKAQLSSYAPAIDSIRENMTSLEHKVLGQPEIKVDHNNELKDEKEPEEYVEKHISVIPNRIKELKDLQMRIKSLEKLVTEKKISVATQNNTAIGIGSLTEQENEVREERDPEGELIDTLKFRKTKAELILNFEDVKQTPPLQEENQLSVDKIEAPTGMHELKLGNNERKTLEIDSNAEELESLQKTVQDLKRKTERNRKRRMKTVDLETMKRQLTEVEETLVYMAKVTDPAKTSPEENPHTKALAKIGSEKTEQLHLEVQMIQNMFLKLENRKKTRGTIWFLKRTGIVTTIFRIWSRSGRRKGKGLFKCCRPSSSGHMGGNR